jgi:hypothetical protein
MADKQLARSTDVDPNAFSDDDPLSELARIVGYDNRPALQQLQELERHREAVRYDPIVDLEEELMREFDAYDAPAAAPAVAAPLVETYAPVEAYAPAEPAPVEMTAPLHALHVQAEPVVSARHADPVFDAPHEPEMFVAEETLDLDRELEMSLGSAADLPVETPAPVHHRIDPLLETVDHLPVQAPVAPPVPQTMIRTAAVAEAGRKNNYPFTPNFSRATPVALNGAAPRTFATPLPAAPVAVAPVAPSPLTQAPLPQAPVTQAPVAQAPAAPAPVAPKPAAAAAPAAGLASAPMMAAAPAVAAAAPVAAAHVEIEEPEPDFDLDNFEIDLSDIDLDFDMEQAAVAEEPVERFVEPELPFDPSMIAEADYGVIATGEIDVPQLPVVEETKALLDSGDYDLDIDAEMAQIFSAGRKDSERATRGAGLAPASLAGAAAAPARSSHEEFADFERAMEEDFRRSMSQRQEVLGQGDRYAEQDAGNDNRARPRGKLFLMASAAAIVLVAGGVGAYSLMGGVGSSFSAGGEPQIILADKTPTKMVPVDKGGKTVPNQDKAVYDRVAGAQEDAPQQGTLVSSTEEPMDVVQRTLTPESLPLERDGLDSMAAADEDSADRLMPDESDAVASAPADDDTPAVAPRKVRTMIVKPDGTLVAREDIAPAEDETVAAVEPVIKTVKTSVPKTTVAKANSALAPVAEDEVGALAAAAQASVPNVSAEVAKTQPLPAARPVTKPVETAQATRKPVDTFATSATPEASPVQTASIAPGSYVVQVASLPSEAEAQKSYKSLTGKFGSVIAGRGVDIKKADIAGKGTYYRVRIPAGSRDEANALCSRLKSAGGSCLVTR